LFREFEQRLSPTMRQQHVAGHKLFVDYSGKRVPIVDPLTGEVRMAEIFVAVLGASSCTYAEATWTQTLPDWIGAHVRMFRFYGVAPRLLVPDNLKSGINKASFYDPEVNRSYAAMAAHYSVGVLPARPRRPRDKAAVEAGVRFAQSYIITFDGGRLTSDGGVMLLAAAERRLGIADKLAALIAGSRDPHLVTHGVADILRARTLAIAIACGYEDGSDLDRLRTDPGFKLACGRLPDSGADLCSHPTVSRWENTPNRRKIAAMSNALIDIYCASHGGPPREVTDDMISARIGLEEINDDC
jgi:hypothetical protein